MHKIHFFTVYKMIKNNDWRVLVAMVLRSDNATLTWSVQAMAALSRGNF